MTRLTTMATRLLIHLTCVLALAVGVAACGGGGGDDAPGEGAAAPAGEPEPAATAMPAEPVEGRFDVGGHELWLRCVGGGPVVVYLHPYVADESSAGSRDAGYLPELLRDRHRVCVYDRANVGRSDDVDGRQTGADSVRDLRRLLDAAQVDAPYVLVGSGFGGLLAGMYAATYPQRVAGMVLVDARLPGDAEVEQRFFPPSLRTGASDWMTAIERLDQVSTFEEARRLEGDEPEVPVTYLGPEELNLDPSLDVNQVRAVIRDVQATYVERFSPGRLVLVDSARPMEAVVPDRIAEEVARVVEDARETAAERQAEQD